MGLHGLPAWFTCRIKKRHVSNPPCGPPSGQLLKVDSSPLYLTHMLRLVRYDFISLIAHVGTFNTAKLQSILACDILLNALEKSIMAASTAVGSEESKFALVLILSLRKENQSINACPLLIINQN